MAYSHPLFLYDTQINLLVSNKQTTNNKQQYTYALQVNNKSIIIQVLEALLNGKCFKPRMGSTVQYNTIQYNTMHQEEEV